MEQPSQVTQEEVAFKNEIICLTSNFIKERKGKGPLNVKVNIEGSTIHITLIGILTKMEKLLIHEYPQYDNLKCIETLKKNTLRVFQDEFMKELELITKREIEFISCNLELIEDRIVRRYKMK